MIFCTIVHPFYMVYQAGTENDLNSYMLTWMNFYIEKQAIITQNQLLNA